MRILVSVLLLLIFVPGWSGEERNPALGADTRIDARAVTLDPLHAGRRRVGNLTWIGGIELRGRGEAFGGFSSIYVRDGRITLLSDGGNIVSFQIQSGNQLTGIQFAELPAGPGTGWRKMDRDSESMAVDPSTGVIWVGFENSNEIWRYGRGFASVEAHAAPPAMSRWPENRGPEAMALMPNRRMLVIAEATPWPHGRGRAALMFDGDPVAPPRRGFRFSYMPPDGYDVSDATAMPDGRVLVLNRRFDLPFIFSAKITLIDPRSARPGALIRGREIATLAPPLIHDNFEGITTTREAGAIIVWLVSDDNQSELQHSYLLKFKLDPVTAATGALLRR